MHRTTLIAAFAVLTLPVLSSAALLPTICDYSIFSAANCTSTVPDLITTIDDELPPPTRPPMPPGWEPHGKAKERKTGGIGVADGIERDEIVIKDLVKTVVSVPVERTWKERSKRGEFPVAKSFVVKKSMGEQPSKDSTTGPIGNPSRGGTHGGGDELPIENPGLPVQSEDKYEGKASEEKEPGWTEEQPLKLPIVGDEVAPKFKTITATPIQAQNTAELEKRDDFLTLLISGTFTFTTFIPKPTMKTLILFEMVNVPLLERMRQQQITVRVTKVGDYLKPMVTVGPDDLFAEKVWPGLEQIVAPRDGEEDDSLKRPTIYGYYEGAATGPRIGMVTCWAIGLGVLVGVAVLL